MGVLEMIDKRKVYIGLAALLSLIIIVVALTTLTRPSNSPASVQPGAMLPKSGDNSNGTIISYVDAITGKLTTDSPNKALEATSRAPSIQLDGFDAVYTTSLSDQQASTVQVIVTNFLAAHGGLSIVKAGIKDGQVNRNPAKPLFTFTLVASQPQQTYQVTVQVDSVDTDAMPIVTFKEIL